MTKKPAIEDTAYHEAGHVIAHFVQGLTIDNVSIVAADHTSAYVTHLHRCYMKLLAQGKDGRSPERLLSLLMLATRQSKCLIRMHQIIIVEVIMKTLSSYRENMVCYLDAVLS